MPDFGSATFSQTDSSNASGTMPSWSGAAAPSTLDDAGRALQGAVTREWNWRNYTVTSAGTGTALTLTYSVAPAAYYNGQRFAFITNTAVTGSCTLNVNSLGATTIKKVLGGTLTNLASGDIPAGRFVEVAYNTANTCFVLVDSILPLISDSSGNVGIGTTPTSYRLHVLQTGGSTISANYRTDQSESYITFRDTVNASDSSVRIGSAGNSLVCLTSGTERLRIDSSGNVLNVSSGGLGYGSGSGGSVTQLTSKGTSVTLNKTNGQITMNNAALAANTVVQFSCNNSAVAVTDTIVCNFKYDGAINYQQYNVWATPLAGIIVFYVRNITAGSLSEACVINFSVIKAVTA